MAPGQDEKVIATLEKIKKESSEIQETKPLSHEAEGSKAGKVGMRALAIARRSLGRPTPSCRTDSECLRICVQRLPCGIRLYTDVFD